MKYLWFIAGAIFLSLGVHRADLAGIGAGVLCFFVATVINKEK